MFSFRQKVYSLNSPPGGRLTRAASLTHQGLHHAGYQGGEVVGRWYMQGEGFMDDAQAEVELASYVQAGNESKSQASCYSTQIEVRPSPELSEPSRIIATAVLFQRGNCKSIG
eukprot:1148706-Pelagomonas_calceolata.AAC.4